MSDLDLLRKVYGRPRSDQALVQAMKDYMRNEKGAASLRALVVIAEKEARQEDKERNGA